MTATGQRMSFLDSACGATGYCGKGSKRLLRAHEDSFGLLDAPDRALATIDRPSITHGPGEVIGPYTLLELIGEGGMGAVWMAEQSHPVRRKVALKIIKPGMDSRQVIARFEAERQALAMMDHPNIAKVLDAGTTRERPALLRHGAGRGRADHRVLRRPQPDHPRAAGAVPPGLPRGAARPPEGDHPPRPQAVERAGGPLRRRAGPQGHRLRRGQGDRAEADRADDAHAVRPARRHARVHEPRAGGVQRARTSTPAATSTPWACSCTNC